MARRPPAVARVLERVTSTAREHDMFSPGDRVLVAVSGGPDSTCLLHSLHMLRRLFKIELEVFHFDHRLRSDSAKDAQYVNRMATKLKLPFHLRIAETKPARGESVEAWARTQRLMAWADVTRDAARPFARVAYGHTLDDQAETVLIALVRGAGLEGVAGIAAVWGPIVHPLLDVRRNDVEAFCRQMRLRPRRDPMNDDLQLLRNAIRHRVIPAMETATGREVKGPFARTASLLQQDARELRRQAESAHRKVSREKGCLDANKLPESSPAIAGRVVRLSLLDLDVPPTDEAVEGILDLARGRPGRKRNLPGGLIAVREKEYVRLSRTSPGSAGKRGGKGGV